MTGQFTFDAAAMTVSDYTFQTPGGVINSTLFPYAGVAEFQGISPATTFTAFSFSDLVFDRMVLVFQSPLAAFDGNSFYTGLVLVNGGATRGLLTCSSGAGPNGSGCDPSVGYFSNFSSGAATLAAPAPVPEPASMALLGIGLAGLGAKRWRQRRKA